MASKRAVAVLRPAVNGFGTRMLRTQCSYSSAAATEELGKTDLHELHTKYGAKFVPFGGYLMPVQYSDLSIIDSHNWTREKASLFDVGHM
jgi:aminomethyltransferase